MSEQRVWSLSLTVACTPGGKPAIQNCVARPNIEQPVPFGALESCASTAQLGSTAERRRSQAIITCIFRREWERERGQHSTTQQYSLYTLSILAAM
jgi:hypothetical protein